jgi:hypothetical protein
LPDRITHVRPRKAFPSLDITRAATLDPSRQGIIILDGWGGIHPVPNDIEDSPVYFANNRVSGTDSTLLFTVGMPYIDAGFDDPTTPDIDEADLLSQPARRRFCFLSGRSALRRRIARWGMAGGTPELNGAR